MAATHTEPAAQDRAACLIQGAARCKRARSEANKLRATQQRAACLIQDGVRGRWARSEAKKLRATQHARLNRAATVLQAKQRGNAARQHAVLTAQRMAYRSPTKTQPTSRQGRRGRQLAQALQLDVVGKLPVVDANGAAAGEEKPKASAIEQLPTFSGPSDNRKSMSQASDGCVRAVRTRHVGGIMHMSELCALATQGTLRAPPAAR